MTTEPLTPDAVRALIAEAREYVEVLDAGQLKPGLSAVDIILRQAAALEGSLPREDADLDAIESRAAWAGSYSTDGVQAAAERFRIARVDMPALLARVRTAEANAQRYRDQAVAAEEETRSWRSQVLASRTAETAEEWEYGIQWRPDGAIHWEWDVDELRELTHAGVTTWRRRAPGAAEEFVPPTPEEADRDDA